MGFGITDPYVIGYYCPSADTDPEALKLNTPKERVAPVDPTSTSGSTGAVVLVEGTNGTNGAPCKEDRSCDSDETKGNLCCGTGSNLLGDDIENYCGDGTGEDGSGFTRGQIEYKHVCSAFKLKFAATLSVFAVANLIWLTFD